MSRVTLARAPLLSLVLLLSLARAATAQFVRSNVWQPNGPVYAMAASGNTLYVGGAFSALQLPVGEFAELDASSGRCRDRGFALTSGGVNGAASDGSGGWFLGGWNLAGGSNVVHVLADGSLAPLRITGIGEVTALAVSGPYLYVGGPNLLAAFNSTSGHATPWHPSMGGSGRVLTLAISGGVVYVGGAFDSIDGVARTNAAAIHATTGQVMDWAPNPDQRVTALIEVDGSICIAGFFTHVGGVPRGYLAMLDEVVGAPTEWIANANGIVLALGRMGSTIVAGGMFTSVGNVTRTHLAMIDARSGAIGPWQPSLPESVQCAAVLSDRVVVVSHTGYGWGRITCFDVSVGEQQWQVTTLVPLTYVASADDRVFAAHAGALLSATRSNLAAIDLATGQPMDWSPTADGTVRALALIGDKMYLAGEFTDVHGQARRRLAAVSATTGEVLPWNPNADGTVQTLAVANGTVFVGGNFWSVGGTTRMYVAALDTLLGQATTWQAEADDWVNTLTVDGSTVFAGGWFTSIGGAARNRVAALSVTDGTVGAWNPSADGPVYVLEAQPGRDVLAGGAFTSIGGAARTCLAALDASSGQAAPWNPGATCLWPYSTRAVYAVARTPDAIYVGGDFLADAEPSSGTRSSRMLIALDPVSAQRLPWAPLDSVASANVRAIVRTPNSTIAGGELWWVKGSLPWTGVLVAADASTLDVPAQGSRGALSWLGQNRPNPYGEATTIRFTLPRGGVPRLDVIDVQGRIVLTPLEGAWHAPGQYDLRLSARNLTAGLYWYRLTLDGSAVTKRMVVIR